jgi:hypothetical protein
MSWEKRTAYMTALHRLKSEVERETSRAQLGESLDPSAMIAAWEKVQVARIAVQADSGITV